MMAEQVEQILDLTNPDWRTIDPMKFETFKEYTDIIAQLVDDGVKKLGIDLQYIH